MLSASQAFRCRPDNALKIQSQTLCSWWICRESSGSGRSSLYLESGRRLRKKTRWCWSSRSTIQGTPTESGIPRFSQNLAGGKIFYSRLGCLQALMPSTCQALGYFCGVRRSFRILRATQPERIGSLRPLSEQKDLDKKKNLDDTLTVIVHDDSRGSSYSLSP